MTTKKATARKAEKIETNNDPNFIVDMSTALIAKGVKILKKLDETLTSVEDARSKFKSTEQRLGEDLVAHIASYGDGLNYEQILHIKNTLYDALLWKRVGAKQKGRMKVNRTINKYFSLIFSFVKPLKDGGSNEQLTSETKFADIRQAYSEVGLKKPIKDSNYRIAKLVRRLFDLNNLKSKKDVDRVEKLITSALTEINQS